MRIVFGIEVDMMVELVMEVKVEIVVGMDMEAVFKAAAVIGMRNSRSR